ncbi:extracellular solute-binding protein [Pseudooceanicola sp.]|uniref:extracellular solute-binding protein n=1 Tax=Pseudooceanicola sp. TaxID=1914328 RepID=UPI00262A31E7|nr:extracellular solute-binding protein [Pseudooceanicola sp.]MDF1857090.1 extracellular solute-binding protein [Pseudooceanicola sp.]
MRPDYFQVRGAICALFLTLLTAFPAGADSAHGIAMYGDPALPPDFVALPYVNPEAPKGGRVVTGNTGGFDSLNPFVQQGTPPWQLRYLTHESLMYRSQDEPFSLYGLLAESVEVPEDRSWVEFTLRDSARFSDGSKVTVEDVIWSFETLGTQGNARYLGFWTRVDKIEQTGPRQVRLSFADNDRELALIAGLRPILKKAQWQGKDFANARIEEAPIGSAPYVIDSYVPARNLVLKRNPEYWGKDLPIRRGTNNFDEIRIEFYGDSGVMFEAFKAGELSYLREFNADKWAQVYDFPAMRAGEMVKSEFASGQPSGITGFVINTRRKPFDDIRVRDALMYAFNFEFINDTMTGGRQPRITSYFSGSDLAMRPGPAAGRVRDLLLPFADQIPEAALSGYALPAGDGSARNRGNIRRAMALLQEAGFRVQDGVMLQPDGSPFTFDFLLRQGATEYLSIADLYLKALERLGIRASVSAVDDAQYNLRQSNFDFDISVIRRSFSLSPGNEQRLYWGGDTADQKGSRNLMGVKSPAIDAMIDTMIGATSQAEFLAAVRALDRLLTAGRYVIPIYQYDVSRVAHDARLKHPERIPIYGDSVYFLPEVWWFAE